MAADAAIFDVDGTLVDSVDLHARAWQEAFADFGRRVAFDEVRAQIGKGGDQLMPVFIAQDDLARRSKPHPDIFEAALKRLGSSAKKRVFVVGDTPWDAIAAHRLGVRCIGVLCGGFAERDLLAAGCIAIYRDPEDLLARLDESPIVR